MQALEMEEIESLVGNDRKKLNTSRLSTSNQKVPNTVATVAIKRSFVTNVIIFACFLVLVLMFVTIRDSERVDPAAVSDFESKSPVSAPDVNNAVPTEPLTDNAVNTPEPPTSPPVAPEPAPTEPPVKPEPAPTNPPVKPTPAPTDPPINNDPVEDQEGQTLPYSKLSAFTPLMDPPLPNEEAATALADEWGKWKFWDGEEDFRPKEDYIAKYPNNDCPGDDFPDNAWQIDAVFVNHYLNDADKLISRAMEAIFTEYGHPRAGLEPAQMTARMQQFHWEMVDMATAEKPPPKYTRRGDRGDGGWTSKRSYNGLVRRLLHAMMTSDTFTVVMGGHSAAAGEGNHFRQNQMMQFHKVMAPIFARLGVKLITRNMSMGGLGTIHNSLGMQSIYGDEIDILIWDTGMTEGQDLAAIDMFIRQGLLSGKRVPIIWGSGLPFDLLKMYHENADVDIGEFGLATDLLPEVKNHKQAKNVPWAARYMKCADGAEELCKEEPRFCTVCWTDRSDGITPETRQRESPRGQVSWHPGWRPHQLIGRNLAFAVLKALASAVNTWTEQVMGGPPLADESWHVTEYYDNIRNKLMNLDESLGKCFEYADRLPTRMCTTPMKAATQYTPRANPEVTSITSIIKPAPDGYVPTNKNTILFEGPDPPNPCFQVPDGEVDVYGIVAGRRRLKDGSLLDGWWNETSFSKFRASDTRIEDSSRSKSRGLKKTDIVPGRGWEVVDEPSGYCDGTYDAICHRDGSSECVLQGQHASRGAVLGNEFSGWLVMNLADVKEGIIVIKIHTWHPSNQNKITSGWTTPNDERVRRRVQSQAREKGAKDETDERELWASVDTPEQPDTMVFEYAIDGKITTLNKEEFFGKKQQIQRVVETLTLLDDPSFTAKARDVEIAIRMRGCGRKCSFALTHVYWA